MGTKLRIKIGDAWHEVEVLDLDADPIEVIVDGEPVQVAFPTAGKEVKALSPAKSAATPAAAPAQAAADSEPLAPAAGPVKVFSSPMPGVIVSVAVKQGDQVVPGDEVCVLEAMKMQQTLRAEWAGLVREVHVQTGQQMQGGDPIVTLE
jgi:glutaconyl-CoA/methylmalonyl-CoA decarboxylase subunit gamma